MTESTVKITLVPNPAYFDRNWLAMDERTKARFAKLFPSVEINLEINSQGERDA